MLEILWSGVSAILLYDSIYYCWYKVLLFYLFIFLQKQLIKLMLHQKPEDRPEATTLKAELGKWAQIFSAQNMSKKNETI